MCVCVRVCVRISCHADSMELPYCLLPFIHIIPSLLASLLGCKFFLHRTHVSKSLLASQVLHICLIFVK